MADLAPLGQIKALETALRAVLSRLDSTELSKGEQKVITALKNDLTDARLDIRDYEFSDTRAEQQGYANQATATLEKVRAGILAASEYNVFNAVDVAQFTAQLEQLSEEVQ